MNAEEKLKKIGYRAATDTDINKMLTGTVISYEKIRTADFNGLAVSVKNLMGKARDYMFLNDNNRGGFIVAIKE